MEETGSEPFKVRFSKFCGNHSIELKSDNWISGLEGFKAVNTHQDQGISMVYGSSAFRTEEETLQQKALGLPQEGIGKE